MIFCQKYKEITERIYNEIIELTPKLKDHSEDELRYQLRNKIEEFFNIIEEKKPIFLEEHRIDILIGDIVVETKKLGELKGKKIEKYINQTKEYMEKYTSPYGILTDLNKIYFFELMNDKSIQKIEKTTTELFTYENFCLLLEILFEDRKKFISEISLTNDFGYINKNKLIQDLLLKLFSIFISSKNKKTNMIFCEWKKLFNLAETTNKEYLGMRRKALEKYFKIEINQNNEYVCLFVMHTSLSIIVKLLTYGFLCYLNKSKKTKEENISELKKFYENLENGTHFKEMGVINMCQNDFFSWYLFETWDNELFELLLSIKNRASLYEYINVEPMLLKDALQKLYENFIPREIRHSFGEYYTPPAISDLMVSKALNFLNDKIHYRAIDPACGSGTFLISLLKNKILNKQNMNIREISSEVIGIDLNPIAVIISKFNYLLTVYPYFKEINDITDIEISVYLGDSSYMPIEETIDNIKCLTYEYYFPNNINIKFPRIVFPLDFIKSNNFLPTLIKIEEMIAKGSTCKYICDYLFEAIGKNLLNENIKKEIIALIKSLIEYQKENLNTIWLFIFMNYLKPFALQKFDLIIGNPPWVRWAVLPYDYKNKIKKSLRNEGVFSRDINYGGVDLNVCALIAYRVIENLSNTNGLLVFLFPQGIMVNKSYEGFRNFIFGDKVGIPVLILKPTKPFFGEEPIILFLKIKSI